jgi:hypothetical protein
MRGFIKQPLNNPKENDAQAMQKINQTSRKSGFTCYGNGHNSAEPSLPCATSFFQSALHCLILSLNFLSPSVLDIHAKNKSSSSGTKNDESKERTVSKFADDDVM